MSFLPAYHPVLASLDATVALLQNVVRPTIIGVTTSGETLSVNPGQWAPTPEFISYQWLRDGVEAAGRTDPTYTLDDGDIGKKMSVRLSGLYMSQVVNATSLETQPVIDNAPPEVAPVNEVLPSFTGKAQSGITLFGSIGQWTGFPAPTFTYQWTRDGSDISGATALSYRVTDADVGSLLRLKVTGANTEGNQTATSAPSATVVASVSVGAFELLLNMGGMETGSFWSAFTITIPHASIDYFTGKGVKKFRLTVDGSKAQPELFGDLNLDYMNKIKDVIDYCATKDAAILLDLHDFGQRTIQVTTSSTEFLDTSTAAWSRFNTTSTADGIIATTVSGQAHTVYKQFASKAGQAPIKLVLKAGVHPWVRIILRNNGDQDLLVDLATGTIVGSGSTSAGLPRSILPRPDVGEGFYEINFKPNVGIGISNAQLIFEIGNASADYASFVSTGRIFAGDGVSTSLYIKSVELGSSSSVIKGVNYDTPDLPISAGADWWRKVVTWLLANANPAGFYGIDQMNEPYVWSSDTCLNFHKACIIAVRAAGFTGDIHCGGIPWSNGPTWWEKNPNMGQLKDVDPLVGKLVFQGHGYPDRDSSGSNFGVAEWGQPRQEGPPGAVTDRSVLIDRFRNFIEGCEAVGVRAALGETGVDNFGGPTSILCFQDTIDYLIAHKVQWFVWAVGPVWPETYGYSLEPRVNGLQAPTMVLFDDYYGNPAPTLFELYGTDRFAGQPKIVRLPQGDSTATFTVNYNGRLTSSKVVTFSDNGGGGTFTPPTVTLAAGANATATTVYTPNGEQLVRISASAPGWTEANGGFDFSSEPDIYDERGVDPASAANIVDWQRQMVSTFKGPIAQFARDSDQATMDVVPVGQGYNGPNYGIVPDMAAVVAWAGGPFRLKFAYNQAQNGAVDYALGPANNDGRTPAYSELPLMEQDNDGLWYPRLSQAQGTRMRMKSDLGVKGHLVTFTTKFESGSKLIAWDYTNTTYGIMPTVAQTWSPNVNAVAPTNTIPNERGDMPFAVKAGEWHVYTSRWTCAISTTAERQDGWKTWRDDELIGIAPTGAASLNVDYGRHDTTIGWFRFGGSTYNGLFGPIYIFRDTDASLPVLPDETATLALIDMQVERHGIAPAAWDNFAKLDFDFTTATYKVDGSNVTLTDHLTGTHSRNSDGLLVNSGTAAKGAAGALLAALQSKEFVIQIEVGAFTGVPSANLRFLDLTTSTGAVGWFMNNLTVTFFTNGNRTGSTDVTGPHTLQISQENDLQVHCAAPSTPVENAYITTGTITAATLFGSTASGWGDVRIKRIRISRTPFKTGWDFIEKMRDYYFGAPGDPNPNDLRLGVNLGSFYKFPTGEPDYILDYYLARRAKTFRVVVDWDGSSNSVGIQPVAQGPFVSTYLSNLQRVVNRLLAGGAEVILDCHEFGANLNRGQAGDRTTADFVQFWGALTSVMPKSPLVGYCLMNEPNSGKGPGGVAITKLQYTTDIEQPAINAIRAAGGVGPIHVSIYGTYTAASSAAGYADDKLFLTDPLNNLVLEVHEYYNSDGGGNTSDAVEYKATAQAIKVMKWAKDNGWTLYWGEIGMGNTNSGGSTAYPHVQETHSFYKLVSAHRDVVRGVAAWTGGRLQSDAAYIYSHDPRFPTDLQKGSKHNVAQLSRWSAPADLALQAPYNYSAPVITGTIQEGQVLTCSPGGWDRADSFTYLWFVNGVSTGTTTNSYLLQNADVGKRAYCQVTGINGNGSTISASNQSGAVQPAAAPASPVNAVAPVVSGTPTLGSTLTLSPGLWSGFPAPTYTQVWKRNGTVIAGQTAATYVLTAADIGKDISGSVTATNTQGSIAADSNVLAIPDPTPLAASVTPGTEVNVSALEGDLTNVFELTAAADPTATGRQAICGKVGQGSGGEGSVRVWTTASNWSAATKVDFSSETSPSITYNDRGDLYLATSDKTPAQLAVRRMLSGNTTFNAQVNLQPVDKPVIHVDRSATSPRLGRIYVGGRSANSNAGIRISYSTDLGASFTEVLCVGSADFNAGTLHAITTAPDGTVYVGVVSRASFLSTGGTMETYYIGVSKDGGASYSFSPLYTPRPVSTPGPGIKWNDVSLAVHPTTGRLHVIVRQGQPSPNPTIFVHFWSDDKGDSWATTGDFNPGLPSGYGAGPHALAVNAAGHLYLQFLAVNASGSMRLYGMASKNDGADWSAPVKVNGTDSTVPLASSQSRVPGAERTRIATRPDGIFMSVWPSHQTGNNVYAGRLRPTAVS